MSRKGTRVIVDNVHPEGFCLGEIISNGPADCQIKLIDPRALRGRHINVPKTDVSYAPKEEISQLFPKPARRKRQRQWLTLAPA